MGYEILIKGYDLCGPDFSDKYHFFYARKKDIAITDLFWVNTSFDFDKYGGVHQLSVPILIYLN